MTSLDEYSISANFWTRAMAVQQVQEAVDIPLPMEVVFSSFLFFLLLFFCFTFVVCLFFVFFVCLNTFFPRNFELKDSKESWSEAERLFGTILFLGRLMKTTHMR